MTMSMILKISFYKGDVALAAAPYLYLASKLAALSARVLQVKPFLVFYVFILGLKSHDAIYDIIKAAEIPTDDAVNPPRNIPIKPS